jgi:arylsulfatase
VTKFTTFASVAGQSGRAAQGDRENSRPNLVLLSVDSLRADHCGFLGDDRGLTPTMDRLAREGVAFETAIAPGPQTFSSMPAVFTGQFRPAEDLDGYPGETHWQRRLAAIDAHLDRFGSLAHHLSRRGYDTAGISPNPWTSTASGFDRGFDQFLDRSKADGDGRLRRLLDRLPRIDPENRAVELVIELLTGSSFFSQWDSLYDDLLATRAELSEPYFLWVFLLDTHFPFVAARKHREEQSLAASALATYRSEAAMRGETETMSPAVRGAARRGYRDTIRAVDDFLETFTDDFADDDPTILLHSDHGESFGEHGNYGHKHRAVYEENVHVPYLVWNADWETGPEFTLPNCVERPVSLASIHDHVIEIADTGVPELSRDAAAGEPVAFTSSEGGHNRAVRGRRFKYYATEDGEELFDLVEDPAEERDRSRSYGRRVETLRERLVRFERHRTETLTLQRAAQSVVVSTDL